jgi:Respiratory nitrate reductase beta C-terminal/Nitrate reductase gamma subunit
MVWYVPPFSPIQSAAEAGKMGSNGDMPDVRSLRIPLKYLANLLTAGDEEPVALNLIVFGWYPYMCLTVFLVGSLLRFDREQYTWKTGSSQLLRHRRISSTSEFSSFSWAISSVCRRRFGYSMSSASATASSN